MTAPSPPKCARCGHAQVLHTTSKGKPSRCFLNDNRGLLDGCPSYVPPAEQEARQ